MRLVVCPKCRTQFDTSRLIERSFECPCGETVANRIPAAVHAPVKHCGSCGALLREEAPACERCGARVFADARRLGLVCPECGARNPDSARYCMSCALEFRPQLLPVQGEEVSCPRCARRLVARTLGGVVASECPGCRGLWAGGEGLEQLLARAVEARRRVAAARPGASCPPATPGRRQPPPALPCPVCHEAMRPHALHPQAGFPAQCCPQHGAWLDAEELAPMARFVLSCGGALDSQGQLRGRPGGSLTSFLAEVLG